MKPARSVPHPVTVIEHEGPKWKPVRGYSATRRGAPVAGNCGNRRLQVHLPKLSS